MNKFILTGAYVVSVSDSEKPLRVRVAKSRYLTKAQEDAAKAEGKPVTDFFTVNFWNKQATLAKSLLSKRSIVNLEMSVRENNYKDSTGKTNYGYEFNGITFEVVGTAKSSEKSDEKNVALNEVKKETPQEKVEQKEEPTPDVSVDEVDAFDPTNGYESSFDFDEEDLPF